jgi:DNA-binding transcriptional LysR family regulator
MSVLLLSFSESTGGIRCRRMSFAGVRAGTRARRLLDGSCQLALIYDMDIQVGIAREQLYSPYPHVLLHVDHPLAGREEVSLKALAGEPLILLDMPPSEHFFRSAFAIAGVDPNIRYRTASFEHARALVARGLGYTLLTQRLGGAPESWDEFLISKPIFEDVPPQPIVLATPSRIRLTLRAEALRAYCREFFGQFVQ